MISSKFVSCHCHLPEMRKTDNKSYAVQDERHEGPIFRGKSNKANLSIMMNWSCRLVDVPCHQGAVTFPRSVVSHARHEEASMHNRLQRIAWLNCCGRVFRGKPGIGQCGLTLTALDPQTRWRRTWFRPRFSLSTRVSYSECHVLPYCNGEARHRLCH